MLIILIMACKCELRQRIKEAAIPWVPERTVYMDYNATTPVDPRVIGAFERACRKNWGNPSSLHTAGTSGWNELEQLRESAAEFFGTDSEGFYLCSSGTETLSASIFGIAARYKNIKFFTTSIEHQAVAHPLFHLKRKTPAAPAGFRGESITLPVARSGKLSREVLEQDLSAAGLQRSAHTDINNPRAALVISPVNHETGSIQPIKELAQTASEYGALVILDGVQAAARLTPSEWAPFCDIFCVSGHKLYAPKGTALLWKRPGLRINPTRFGGSQEDGLFPGTENTPGAAAFAEALKLMKREQNEELGMLKSLVGDGLSILKNSGLQFNIESPEESAPGVLCISLSDLPDMEKLIFSLNESNICLSRFSACSERLDGKSKILTAMGIPEERTSHSIRISLGRWSRRDDFFKLAKTLKQQL